jgi:outer membrane protein assembly factor BamB
MKKLVILLLAILFTAPAMADGEQKQYDKVVVKLVDGRVYDVDIDKNSHIYSFTQEKDGVLVQYVEVNGKSECYIFERNEMLSLRFHETVSTYIEEIKEQIAANPLRFIDGELLFGKEMDGKTYWVFDAAGKEIMSGVVKCDSPVSLEKLPTGFYLAEVDKYKLKVMVR